MKLLKLDVVSSKERLFLGNVQNITVSGSEGELGIHPSHAPMLSLLKQGYVYFTDEEGQTEAFYISGGILNIYQDSVTILSDVAERALSTDELNARNANKLDLQSSLNKMDLGSEEYNKVLKEIREIESQERISALLNTNK